MKTSNKALYDALRSTGMHRINSPIIFCDSSLKIRLYTDVAAMFLGGIKLGSPITAFIDRKTFDGLIENGSIFPGAASFAGGTYSVIIYKKLILSEIMYVVLLLGAEGLMNESYPPERLALPYQRLVYHIDERLDEIISGDIKRPNGTFANDVEQFLRIRNILELFEKSGHGFTKSSDVRLDAFFNQLAADAKYSLLHSIVKLDLKEMPARSTGVKAYYKNMFLYFTLILLNLLTVSINDTVTIKLSELNRSCVKAELSTYICDSVISSTSILKTHPSHLLSLDELALELFSDNIPFALDLAILEEFLRDTGWTAHVLLSDDQLCICTNIIDTFPIRNAFPKNAAPEINLFWVCLNAFESRNPTIDRIGTLRSTYPVLDNEDDIAYDKDNRYNKFEERLLLLEAAEAEREAKKAAQSRENLTENK